MVYQTRRRFSNVFNLINAFRSFAMILISLDAVCPDAIESEVAILKDTCSFVITTNCKVKILVILDYVN